MIATYAVEGESFRAERPRRWSDERLQYLGPLRIFRNFDLHPDGRRLAVLRAPSAQNEVKRDRVVLVFNFFDELGKLAPEGR